MERKPFGVRFSADEMSKLKFEARMLGWPVGQLIRFRALRGDTETEKQIAQQLVAAQAVSQNKER